MKKLIIIMMLFVLAGTGPLICREKQLPKITAALSWEDYTAGVQAATGSGGHVRELALPEIDFQPGKALEWKRYNEIFKLISEMGIAGSRVYLRFRLRKPSGEIGDEDIEKNVAELIDDFVKGMDYKYTGVILSAEENCSPGLMRLTVASFSISLKVVAEETEVALAAEMAVRAGPKILAYVDRLIVNGRDNRDRVLEQLALMQAKQPVSFLVPEEPGVANCRDYLDSLFTVFGLYPDAFIIENPHPAPLRRLLTVVENLQVYLPSYFIRVTAASPTFKLIDDRKNTPEQTVFVDVPNRVVILAKVGNPSSAPRKLRFISPGNNNFALTCYDPLDPEDTGHEPPSAAEIPWDKQYILLTAAESEQGSENVSDSVSVSGGIILSVEEIVARWQRYNKAWKMKMNNYIADARMDMHFEPPGLDTSFDVALYFKYFWHSDGTRYWEQKAQYLNGIKLRTKLTFPMPQLEPEQVVSQPLELDLAENYVYELEKREKIKGNECYVVSFRPRPGSDKALYSGKIWIDSSSFRKVRMLLIQENCSGSILSNKELQFFELVEGPKGGRFNLLVKNDVGQKILAAGREFLLERRYLFTGIKVNSGDFAASLQQTLKSDMPMFTETRAGLRELAIKKDGTRKIKEKVDDFVWSLVSGSLYDGTYNFPIPIIGLSSIDYNFLGKGWQLSSLLVLPILALNLSKQFKHDLTFGSDLFLSALPRNDRLFRGGLEAEGEAAYIFSESFGFRLSWQPVTDFSITASAYLVYEHYLQQGSTSEDFVLPRNGFALNPNLSLDYARTGYRFSLSGSLFNRLGWREWGLPAAGEEPQVTYATAYALFGKRFYVGSFTRIGVDLTYMTGTNRDRFALYQPSMLTNPKIRGVPSGTVSLDTIGILSLNVGFTVFDFMRFDTYYNFARGNEAHGNDRTIDFQGIELDCATIGPRQSYIQARIAYAVSGPIERYDSRWSIYIMVFLPFK